MNAETLNKFQAMFEEQKKNLLYSHAIVSEEFAYRRDDMLDDVDMTTTEMETSMRMRLRNREALFLKKIDEALHRIAEGNFGLCEKCEEEIELRRLEARPTATYCVNCKEEEERREQIHIDGHKPKSLGAKLRLKLA